MNSPITRVAAIHDLSGFGRTSLSIIIPIISSMGIQVCPVPTAILSTHTGGFTDYKFIDLTDHLEEYIGHWVKLGVKLDCLYSGFLGSPRQIDIISHFMDVYAASDEPFIVIDPVLGDNGKLYQTMNNEMVYKMRSFISRADLITPNFTEAVFLLEKKYKVISDQEIKEWLLELSAMGPPFVE
jgi:pyridoxine kinase